MGRRLPRQCPLRPRLRRLALRGGWSSYIYDRRVTTRLGPQTQRLKADVIRARITYDRLLTVEGHEAGAAALIGAIHTLAPFDPTCEATLHTTAAPPAPAVFGLDPTFQIGAEFDYEHTFESP